MGKMFPVLLLQSSCAGLCTQGGPPRLCNRLVGVVDPDLGDSSEAVVTALVAPAVRDVPVEVPHLHSGVPEGGHGNVCAGKHLPHHLVLLPLQATAAPSTNVMQVWLMADGFGLMARSEGPWWP